MDDADLRRLSDDFASLVNQAEPEYELFWRAAQAARDPREAEGIEGLRGHERTALEREGGGILKQTLVLKTSIATMCFSAMIQGWAQTGSNGT